MIDGSKLEGRDRRAGLSERVAGARGMPRERDHRLTLGGREEEGRVV